jgi:hypothetical protein
MFSFWRGWMRHVSIIKIGADPAGAGAVDPRSIQLSDQRADNREEPPGIRTDLAHPTVKVNRRNREPVATMTLSSRPGGSTGQDYLRCLAIVRRSRRPSNGDAHCAEYRVTRVGPLGRRRRQYARRMRGSLAEAR